METKDWAVGGEVGGGKEVWSGGKSGMVWCGREVVGGLKGMDGRCVMGGGVGWEESVGRKGRLEW